MPNLKVGVFVTLCTPNVIKESIKSRLEISQVILIRGSLSLMRSIQERIDELDGEISARIQYRKNDLAIAMSIPGTGFVSATAILAEIGNYTDFKKPEQLAAWCVLFLLYISQQKRLSSEGLLNKAPSIFEER
jgi:transposase